MFFKTTLLAIVATAVVALCGMNEARADAAAGAIQVGFGNNNAGATATFYSNGQADYSQTSATMGTFANANVLGRSNRIGGGSVTAYRNSSNSRWTTWSLDVGGYTLSSGQGTTSFTWSAGGPYTLMSGGTTVWIGPVPVALNGTLGSRGSVSVGISLGTSGVGLSGSLNGTATASVSAGVGVSGLNVSVLCNAQLLNTTLNGSLTCTSNGVRGYVNLVEIPIAIQVALVGRVGSWTYTIATLANYNYSGITIPIIPYR